jgi:hypothetical protein
MYKFLVLLSLSVVGIKDKHAQQLIQNFIHKHD